MAINANEVRKGMAIRYNTDVCLVLETHHRTPGNLRAFVQASLRSLRTGKSADVRFNSNEKVEVVNVSREKYEYSYMDGENFVFTNPSNYETITLTPELVGDVKKYLTDNLPCDIMFVEEKAATVEPPSSVTLKIIESADGVRGDSATNIMKPAVVETGITVQVPLFIKEGELIKIDTRNGEYMGRA
ncbi:MAG: elongation factor P [Verrucomicrobiota bacterium]|nr:elongation factor P [Verrucomicrobiota bacterium]